MGSVAAFFLTAAIGMACPREERAPDRHRPPERLGCSRDKLTAYIGAVTSYVRTSERLTLRIETDWGSTEHIELRYSRDQDLTRWFLFRGEAFRPEHWRQIEEKPGRLRKGMRAAAWVCQGAANPVIDWEPPREAG